MILIVDSGSTKSDWIAIDSKSGSYLFERQRTRGLNPAIISKKEAFDIISENEILIKNKFKVEYVFFMVQVVELLKHQKCSNQS